MFFFFAIGRMIGWGVVGDSVLSPCTRECYEQCNNFLLVCYYHLYKYKSPWAKRGAPFSELSVGFNFGWSVLDPADSVQLNQD